MRLDDREYDLAVSALSELSTHGCPGCGHQEMKVDRYIFELRGFAFGRMSNDEPILPILPAQCPRCHMVVMYNAVELGLLPTSDDGEVIS